MATLLGPTGTSLITDHMELWLWNFSTGQYDKVMNIRGTGPASFTATINNAFQYVDPNTNEMIALYRMVAATLIICSSPSVRYFTSSVDYISFKLRYVVPRIAKFNRETVLDVAPD